ncbi:MAG: hypothetical protein V1878_04125 [bacterium]
MITDPSAVAAAETVRARIQAAYVMALQKRRMPEQARIRILAACRRPEFAEQVEFKKPVGNTTIRGASIRLAEVALREWMNVLTETTILYEDDNIRRSKITCLDLETNTTFSKEIQVRKTVERKSKKGREEDILSERLNTYNETVYVLRATDEELQVKEAALISKAIRNEGLRLIPGDIIDEARAVARETCAARDKNDPEASKKKLFDAFATIGVFPKDLQGYVGHDLANLSPAELTDLRAVYAAIRDGEATWTNYLEKESKEDEGEGPTKPKTKGLYQPQVQPEAPGATIQPAEGKEAGEEKKTHPEPPREAWDPLVEPLMGRYPEDKKVLVRSACEERGIDREHKLLTRDAHAKLLEFEADRKEVKALKASDLIPEVTDEEVDAELGEKASNPVQDFVARLRATYPEAALKQACQVIGFAYALEALSIEALKRIEAKVAELTRQGEGDKTADRF